MAPSYEISIDPARGLLRIIVRGFLSLDDLVDILAAQKKAVVQLGLGPNEHIALCDFSSGALQSQDVIQLSRAALANPSFMARRVAFVITSALARLQLRRMLVRDDAAFFETIEDAEAWLFDDTAPDARVAG
ncbi:hypothetical protein [Sphingomonas sp.]|jgi:hypothetical protein|uniref:hypothetical protein n=1 Tax=Sphingomonas sp. TaxID=28214 RepID=UPI002ED8E1B0